MRGDNLRLFQVGGSGGANRAVTCISAAVTHTKRGKRKVSFIQDIITRLTSECQIYKTKEE